MGSAEVGAVVVGAGAAGLGAALALQGFVSDVLVVDASDRPGGVMRTDHAAGYVVERGPNTLRVGPAMASSLRETGLLTELRRARPTSRLRFVVRDGELVPVPMSPLEFARSDLLSRRAKLRLLREPLVRRGDATGETVAEFARRRLGDEVAERLVGPFLTGVYAGDEDRLGAESVFAGPVEWERSHRSIALGALARLVRRGPRGLTGSWSTSHGLGPLARLIAERLSEPPALRTRVDELRWDGSRWRLSLRGPSGEDQVRSPRVVLAAPAREASELLLDVDTELARLLTSIEYAPILGIPLGVDPSDARQPIEGFGFLVPRAERMSLLGCLFMSSLFPDRAPSGRALLHCMVGGSRWPAALAEPDDSLLRCVLADLERVLGLRGEPHCLGIARWERAVAQPGPHHTRLVAELRRRACGHRGLALAGGYLDGVSVSDSYASGLAAAGALLAAGETRETA